MSTQTIRERAASLRRKNLSAVLSGRAKSEPGGRLTAWQARALESLRHSGMTGLSAADGTVRASVLVPAPNGGHTEEWRVIVTGRDLLSHLADPAAT